MTRPDSPAWITCKAEGDRAELAIAEWFRGRGFDTFKTLGDAPFDLVQSWIVHSLPLLGREDVREGAEGRATLVVARSRLPRAPTVGERRVSRPGARASAHGRRAWRNRGR